MDWQLTLGAAPLFAATLVATAVAVAVYRNRHAPGARALAVIAVFAGWWSLSAGLELLSTDPLTSVVLTKASYFGIVIVPVAWVVFVLAYTGRWAWLSRRRIALLSVVPTITVVAAITNDPAGIHSLFWRDLAIVTDATGAIPESRYGPLFWIHAAYSYLLLAIGSYLLIELVVTADLLYRAQASVLLMAVLAPWSANVLYLSNLIRTPYDPTILGIVLTCCLLLVTVYRHRFLEIGPAARYLARTELIETLDDPVVVIDSERHVIELNPTAVDVFGVERPDAIGGDLAAVSSKLCDWLDSDRVEETIVYEVGNVDRYYDVQATPLPQGTSTDSGALLALRDVTARQHNRQQVSVLNRLLRHNLSNAVTTIHGNAEYAAARADDDEVRDRIRVIRDNAAAMMDKQEKLDRILRTFERERYTCTSLDTLLGEVVTDVQTAHPAARITVDLPDATLSFDGKERLRFALKELLTNAIEHTPGDAPTVSVTATVVEDQVQITVRDQGPGIPDHELEPITDGQETQLSHGSGVGLWLVSWIVHSLDGAVDFETGEDGTTVTLTVPGRE
ncbi:Signal transduction histidine kinase, contains PAS domain [Halorhabdus sp. SVX81]|uniref:histidine kinase N-terminal 7TM domain-containing protein n=1 Tax=Halorhabdus sp. SVX81 TaxID=2978283 RepID=UPI0023DC6A60|nr:histidine kinase N-terminal 7TM domain-containing protein [Halorhabdus sp. SVX81]WEL16819.1 Signal transduction histidine kinase, contains PAS domain [Halorhabdus sp. SVX81]